MVDRYRSSTGVPVAGAARPSGPSPLSTLASGVGDLAQTAVTIATKKVEERKAAMEAAALNQARIDLEKQGTELALTLQKNRVAGSNYVPDLEKARAPLKDNIWNSLPENVKRSTRAQQMWSDIWTSDQIGATRSASIWQAGQEKEYSIQTLDKALITVSARVEADPDSAQKELEGWKGFLPTQSGLLDQETLAKAETAGVQSILQSATRGLAKQGRFDEAEKLVKDAAAKLDPQQRKAFESVIEDAKNDIEREKNRREAELNKTQRLNANRTEVDILDGKVTRSMIDAKVAKGEISENDKPSLIRSLRAENDRRRIEAEQSKLSDAAKEEWKGWSMQTRMTLESTAVMTPAEFMRDPTQWEPDLFEAYQHLTPEDQRAVDKRRLEMRETGRTTNEVDRVERLLIDEAKRIAPTGWNVGSEAKDKTPQARELAGALRQAASEMAPQTGGRELPPEELRKAAALAIGRVKGGENLPVFQWEMQATAGVPTLADINSDGIDRRRRDGATDQSLYSDVFATLQKKLGRPPTMQEVQAGYAQALGALQ